MVAPQTDQVILGLTKTLDPALVMGALESAPTIIYVYDVKADRSVFQNRRFGELLGQPEAEADEDRSEWQRHIHPDDAASFPDYRARLKRIRPGEKLGWEFRMRHADGDWRYFASSDVLLSSDATGAPWLVVGNAVDVTEQKRAEERRNLILAEMRHRTRNFATVIEGIGRRSLNTGDLTAREFFTRLMGRLRALLDADELVLASRGRRADVRAVAERTLAAFKCPALAIDGSSAELPQPLAGSIALALHELATNATKYGALSEKGGNIDLSWHRDGDNFRLEWKERCNGAIAPPTREGFGMGLIRYAVPSRSDGTVDLSFEPDGVRCRFEFVLPH